MADSADFNGGALNKQLNGLIGNRFEMPNVSYTHPLQVIIYKIYKSMKYRIKYSFTIDKKGLDLMENSNRYWSTRGFDCKRRSASIIGKRGSSLGNLTSFNMTKLICDLDVNLSQNNTVTTELLVDGKFQDITEINLWDFKLELILYEYALKDIDFPDFLSEYKKKKDNAAIKWSFTMMRGRDFSPDLKNKLEGLVRGNQAPSVEVIN